MKKIFKDKLAACNCVKIQTLRSSLSLDVWLFLNKKSSYELTHKQWYRKWGQEVII